MLKDFIEGLSRRIVFDTTRQEQKTGVTNFETDAFRLAFEVRFSWWLVAALRSRPDQGALGDLRVLDGVFDRQLEEALDRCILAEQRFHEQMETLLQGQQECQSQLETMDRRMADSTDSAVGVGERLAVASAQRESVEAALEVTCCCCFPAANTQNRYWRTLGN